MIPMPGDTAIIKPGYQRWFKSRTHIRKVGFPVLRDGDEVILDFDSVMIETGHRKAVLFWSVHRADGKTGVIPLFYLDVQFKEKESL